MKIYKITEASEYLGVSINTIKTLANNGNDREMNSYAAIYDILCSRDEFYAELARIKSIPIGDRERKQEQLDLVIDIGGMIKIHKTQQG